jgi:hypothetical protein
MTYTLVTVVHDRDYPLLRLQARSLARYLAPDFASQIYVIANQGLIGENEWRIPLLHDYGYLGDRVRLVDAPDVSAIPSSIIGWKSQQILKLMVAKIVTSDRYMVLDAKNHLIFPLSNDFCENGDRIQLSSRNYESSPMRHYLDSSLQYFDVDKDGIQTTFLPTTTPFIFPTHLVRALIDNIDQREQTPFPLVFDRLGATEFLLFGAFLCSLPGGIGKFYDLSGQICPMITTRSKGFGPDEIQEVVARVEGAQIPFFTIHREAFCALDERSKQAVAALWVRRCLFESVSDALGFITRVCILSSSNNSVMARLKNWRFD